MTTSRPTLALFLLAAACSSEADLGANRDDAGSPPQRGGAAAGTPEELMAIAGPSPTISGVAEGVWLSTGTPVRLQIRSGRVMLASKCSETAPFGASVPAQVSGMSVTLLEGLTAESKETRRDDAHGGVPVPQCGLAWSGGFKLVGIEGNKLSLLQGGWVSVVQGGTQSFAEVFTKIAD